MAKVKQIEIDLSTLKYLVSLILNEDWKWQCD